MIDKKDERTEEEIFDESVVMMNNFSKKTIDDIDESLLMKMRKGPIKKIWEQVIKLWSIVNDPKSDNVAKAIGIGALIYLITPIDALPDIIPVLGLTDDVSIIMYAISQLSKRKRIK